MDEMLEEAADDAQAAVEAAQRHSSDEIVNVRLSILACMHALGVGPAADPLNHLHRHLDDVLPYDSPRLLTWAAHPPAAAVHLWQIKCRDPSSEADESPPVSARVAPSKCADRSASAS